MMATLRRSARRVTSGSDTAMQAAQSTGPPHRTGSLRLVAPVAVPEAAVLALRGSSLAICRPIDHDQVLPTPPMESTHQQVTPPVKPKTLGFGSQGHTVRDAAGSPPALDPVVEHILALQRLAGNSAVSDLLDSKPLVGMSGAALGVQLQPTGVAAQSLTLTWETNDTSHV